MRKQLLPSRRSKQERDALVEQYAGVPKWALTRVGLATGVVVQDENDLLQEGMQALTRAAELWEETGGASFKTYAIKGCLQKMSDAAQRYHKQSENDKVVYARKSEELHSSPFGGNRPVGLAEQQEEQRLLHLALEELPEKERKALLFRHVDHMTCRDIGKALGVHAQTAREIVLRGEHNLREKLLEFASDHPWTEE